jgi:transcriptional regulator with XRE-family HTH domain
MDKSAIEKRLKSLVSTKLKQLRETSGESLEKMAEALDLDYSVLFHIYSGKYLPRLTTLFQISEFYNIKMADWFKELDARSQAILNKKSIEFNLLSNFQKLDGPMQTAVLKILQKLNIKERRHRYSK